MDKTPGTGSNTPALPEWRMRVIAEFACPGCSYDLTHNPVPRCPECGYALQPDDIRFAEHRRIFLDLMRPAPYVRHGFAMFLMFLSIPYIGVFVALPPVLSVLALSAGRGKGQVPRLRRRVWVMSTFWLQTPWIVVRVATSAYEWMYWRFYSYSNFPGELSDWPEGAQFIGVVVVFGAGLWMWRRSLHGLARKASLGDEDPVVRWKSAATRVALISYGLACLVVIIPVMMWTLDTFWPGWA